jgi:hypothetical protein
MLLPNFQQALICSSSCPGTDRSRDNHSAYKAHHLLTLQSVLCSVLSKLEWQAGGCTVLVVLDLASQQ